MEKNYFEWIEDYLSGNLNNSDKTEFESEMENSTELREQVALFPLAGKMVEEHQAHELFDLVGKIKNEEQDETKVVSINNKPKNKFRIFALAASVVLILGFFFTFYQTGQYSDSGIANSNFELYDAGVLLGDGDDSNYRKGIIAYQKKDFTTAVSEFNKVTPSDSDFSSAQFYGSLSLMTLGNPQLAIPTLENLSNSTGPLQEPAEWYRALALLDAGERDKAISALENIANNSDHFYAGKAKEVLEDLGSFWNGWR